MNKVPDPSDIVLMVIPTEKIRESPLLLEINDLSSMVRVVRWGELVSMVLHDSQISEHGKWAKLLGISVPSSSEVLEAEKAESEGRTEQVQHLLPVVDPMVQILAVPTLVGMVQTMADSDPDVNEDGEVNPSSVTAIGRALADALRQSIFSVLSVLVDFDLLLVNDLQRPATEDDNDDEEEE